MLQCVGRTLRSSGSLCLRVCREEHILGVISLLNSLDKMWVSHYHCFIVWWHVSGFCCMVLLLGFVVKQTCFLEWSLTYSGLPYFFFFIMTTITWGINYLTTYFISLLCPYQYYKKSFWKSIHFSSDDTLTWDCFKFIMGIKSLCFFFLSKFAKTLALYFIVHASF